MSTPTARPSTPPSSVSASASASASAPASHYDYAASHYDATSLHMPPPVTHPAHAMLTPADLAQSQAAYTTLLASAKAYRQALTALSTASSSFGAALETCARLKEARAAPIATSSATAAAAAAAATTTCPADLLLAAAGVHQLVANHKHILAETIYRAFEVPLLHELDKWRRDVDAEQASYARAVAAQTREIRRLETESLRMQALKRRDVARFRAHLVQLTQQLDALTGLHGAHAAALLRDSQATSGVIVDAACSLVRAEVDIFEGLARKGWTGGGLEQVLEKGVDLFAPDEEAGQREAAAAAAAAGGQREARLFSVLPAMSILAEAEDAADEQQQQQQQQERSASRETYGRRAFSPAVIRRTDGEGEGLGPLAAAEGDDESEEEEEEGGDDDSEEEEEEEEEEDSDSDAHSTQTPDQR